jgi:hypothetical protein
MIKKSQVRSLSLFLVLFVFFGLTVTIDFFHTEKTATPDPSCPACHFQSSALAIHLIVFFYNPEIRFIEIVREFPSFKYSYTAFQPITARGPPQA